ncbi:MAG: RrF2 family transcriptional regulator [bacterium]
MLRITKKAEYGIIALKHMLHKPIGSVTRAREIAEAYRIPSEIMAKILQELTRKGIIESCQGAKGGYILAKQGSEISLAEIVEALEGPLGIVECVSDVNCNCTQFDTCNISDPFQIIQKQFKIFLAKISLEAISNEMEMQRVAWH